MCLLCVVKARCTLCEDLSSRKEFGWFGWSSGGVNGSTSLISSVFLLSDHCSEILRNIGASAIE